MEAGDQNSSKWPLHVVSWNTSPCCGCIPRESQAEVVPSLWPIKSHMGHFCFAFAYRGFRSLPREVSPTMDIKQSGSAERTCHCGYSGNNLSQIFLKATSSFLWIFDMKGYFTLQSLKDDRKLKGHLSLCGEGEAWTQWAWAQHLHHGTRVYSPPTPYPVSLSSRSFLPVSLSLAPVPVESQGDRGSCPSVTLAIATPITTGTCSFVQLVGVSRDAL